MLYKVFDLEDLLEDRRGQDFLLYCERNTQSFAVRLGPYEVSIGQPNLTETFQLSQADRQKLLRLGLGYRPDRGRGEKTFAVATERNGGLFRYPLRNVDGVSQASNT